MLSIFPKNLLPLFFLIGLLIITIGGIIDYKLFENVLNAQADITESYQTISSANQSLLSITKAALDVSVFLYTGKNEIINKLPEEIIAAQVNMSNLGNLIKDNPGQIMIWNKLYPLFNAKILFLNNIISEYKKGNKQDALEIASDKNRLQYTSEIIQLIINIKKIESSQLKESKIQFQVNKLNAQKLFILVGMMAEILFLIFYLRFRKYL